jgi:lipoyl(octanoyl) transferase
MKYVDWGLIGYEEALNKQLELVHLVSDGDEEEQVICCAHPPVVTLGRGTQDGDLLGWKGEIVEVQRGGRATYHGPSQVVVYPILNLSSRKKDLHQFMRNIELAVIETLKYYNVESGISEGNTGVWIGSKKIASIGIAVKKWISYHGVAINIDHDPNAFTGLKPCGFTTETMISLEELTSKKVDHQEFIEKFKHFLNIYLKPLE